MDDAVIRYADHRVYFQHWPPEQQVGQVDGQRLSHRDVDPDRPWLSSAYYWWWRFLSASKDYLRICEIAETTSGRNSPEVMQSAYPDFGNVFDGNFWSWWWERGWGLFCEPMSYSIRQLERNGGRTWPYEWDESERITLSIARHGDHQRTADEVRSLLERLDGEQPRGRHKKVSGALHQPACKPDIPALQRAFGVWDLHRTQDKLPLYEIAHRCQLERSSMPDDPSWRKDASDHAYRLLERANVIIKNVTRGVFFTKHELPLCSVKQIKQEQFALSRTRRDEMSSGRFPNPFANSAIASRMQQNIDPSLAQLNL